MSYRGRFAPSPTGPLHMGSLVAATGSYLQAVAHHGHWLLRIEDIDTPRCVPGATDSILHTLEIMGFEWHGPVLYQSTRQDAYEAALQQLRALNLCYPCSCSRSELQLAAGTVHDGEELRYPGWCRIQPRHAEGPFAWRFRVPDAETGFTDAIYGYQCICLQDTIGDFVIKRRDDLFAYQLAVVVDDAEQGVTEVVRGADLLLNSPRQIALQRALRLNTPAYVHLPLVLDAHGKKLSKSHAAPELSGQTCTQLLWQALNFLQQHPPVELQHASLTVLWSWAKENWQLKSLILHK